MTAARPSPEVLDEWVKRSWDRRPTFTYEALVEMWREEQASRAKARETDWRSKQLDELRRRVAALERILGHGGKNLVGDIAKGFGRALAESRTRERERVLAEVEQRFGARLATLERGHLKFLGVHEPGRQYQLGNLVVRSGGLWHCNAATHETPGRSNDWQLAVKSGEAGKVVAA